MNCIRRLSATIIALALPKTANLAEQQHSSIILLALVELLPQRSHLARFQELVIRMLRVLVEELKVTDSSVHGRLTHNFATYWILLAQRPYLAVCHDL